MPKGIPAKRGMVISEAEFARHWNDLDTPLRVLADRLGISISAVTGRARTRNLPLRPLGAKPTYCAAQLRKLLSAGLSYPDIAAASGVCLRTVSEFARREGIKRHGVRPKMTLAEYRTQRMIDAMRAEAKASRKAQVQRGFVAGNDGRMRGATA